MHAVSVFADPATTGALPPLEDINLDPRPSPVGTNEDQGCFEAP